MTFEKEIFASIIFEQFKN